MAIPPRDTCLTNAAAHARRAREAFDNIEAIRWALLGLLELGIGDRQGPAFSDDAYDSTEETP